MLAVVALLGVSSLAGAKPDGEMILGLPISPAEAWFDPAETPALTSPAVILYAVHDALVKPMPGNQLAPSLAESWTVSRDGLTYEFLLRQGVKFHNGAALTAEDVKFSFERYKGAAAATLKARVTAVEVVDARRVRFRLTKPWPNFLTFYAAPTGAAWITPRKYVDQVGEHEFKRAPVGAGPYRLVSFQPGFDVVLEAFEGYWRKVPSVKRLTLRVIPGDAARLASLKRGDLDITYGLRPALAEELRRTPGLTLKPTFPPYTEWLIFAEQWESKSPWADRRVRLAANLAVDRRAINDGQHGGFARIASSIVPRDFQFYWPAPAYAHDPARARQLLAEAGYPNGFDGGDVATDRENVATAEAVIKALGAVGIRARLRALESASFSRASQERSFRHLVRAVSAAAGNAATRIDTFVFSGGIRAYGGYADIDALYRDQAVELDPQKRETLLHRIQQLMHEHVMFLPLIEHTFLNGYGPRVEESALGLIRGHPYSAPYEDLRLKPDAR